MSGSSPRILLHIPPTDPLRRIYRLAASRSGTLESPDGKSFDPSAEGAMTTARPPLSLIIYLCLSLLSTDYCLSPCCHTLRRCSLIVRTLCLRREKWDHYPPAVSTRKSYWRLTAVDFINRVSTFSLEMSFGQDQQEHLDALAAEKDSSPSAGVPESERGSTEPPSTLNPTTPIISIRHRLPSIVNRELERMERGEIDELSDQHDDMLHQLASLSVSSSASVCLGPTAQILSQLNQYQRTQGCCPHRRLSPSHPTTYVAYRA